MKEGYTVKDNVKSILSIAVGLIVILICVITILNIKSNETDECMLKNTKVYTTENEKSLYNKINSNGIYFNTEESTEQKLFKKYIAGISIVDIDNLDIQLNMNSNTIIIKSKDDENGYDTLKTIYDGIINNVQNNSTTYRVLMSQFELDEFGQVQNVVLDEESEELRISGVGENPIDIRILYMQIGETGARGSTEENLDENLEENRDNTGLKLVNATGNDESIIFKPEAVYGKATSDVGIEALNNINSLDGMVWAGAKSNETTGVYQVTSFDSLVDTFGDRERETASIENLKVTGLNTTEKNKEIVVYFDDEASGFEKQSIELLNHLGYEVVQSVDMVGCDLIVGYTWMYMNGIQSSLDEELNSALSSHILTGTHSENIGLMFRSAWSLID